MKKIQWKEAGKYKDVQYHKAEGIAKITINRPGVRNAFRPLTVDEMSNAWKTRGTTTTSASSS